MEDPEGSYRNLLEVGEIVRQVGWLVRNWPDDVWGPVDQGQIGVVTPYHYQVTSHVSIFCDLAQ